MHTKEYILNVRNELNSLNKEKNTFCIVFFQVLKLSVTMAVISCTCQRIFFKTSLKKR